MKRKFLYSILTVVFATVIPAQGRNYFKHASLGIQSGVWKPSSLDTEPNKPFEPVKGSLPTYGLYFVSPTVNNFALRATIIQWYQKDFPESYELESVTLRHLSIDLVNYIITQYRISPYVSYGIAFIWSREEPKGLHEKIPLDRAGYGVNVGAGIQYMASSRLALAVEYQYLYAKIVKKVGKTDNYSGAQVTFKFSIAF
ncbi:hypothetical protein JW935_18510 [candidate division KSB1 bacterium]|nr:hypothetical protein [candidate division KSB1 bacterium]